MCGMRPRSGIDAPIPTRAGTIGAPRQKFPDGAAVGSARVRVADVGGEEFQEADARLVAGGGDHGRLIRLPARTRAPCSPASKKAAGRLLTDMDNTNICISPSESQQGRSGARTAAPDHEENGYGTDQSSQLCSEGSKGGAA
jgi:hypothetical protein